MTIPATDAVVDAPLDPLPPEAGDVNAPRFEPDDAWLRHAEPALQKAAMWRWFASHYESPEDPESAAPHDAEGRRVYAEGTGPFHADEVMHARFDAVVPRDVVDDLVRRVQQRGGNDWACRGMDKFSG
jgi:hypothetical protein